jgi:hypothetical protein
VQLLRTGVRGPNLTRVRYDRRLNWRKCDRSAASNGPTFSGTNPAVLQADSRPGSAEPGGWGNGVATAN